MKLKMIVKIVYKNYDWDFFIGKPYPLEFDFLYSSEISLQYFYKTPPYIRKRFSITKESKLFKIDVKMRIRNEQNKMIFETLDFLSWCLYFNLNLVEKKMSGLTLEYFFNSPNSSIQTIEPIFLAFVNIPEFPDFFYLYQNIYYFTIFLSIIKIFKLKR